ncbi:transcriptional regulator [Candidatus Thiomargarita nelsonii]|uniref:Transcriptional regulator n=1 Tax=Candidatus Thiomargarita nelsonii TaxID=1003181 RepID=A0A0A6PB07_9GAMM|nr:transcriptional regulator [Candidatus Thiomargarita nelsonii]
MSEILEKTTLRWESVEEFLSVPHTESEYDKAIRLLNQLIDVVGEDEKHPLAGLMETLGALIEIYENKHYPIPEVSGIEILTYLMEEHDLKSSDLYEIGTEHEVLDILNGKRDLTIHQIYALSNRFHVTPKIFLQQ